MLLFDIQSEYIKGHTCDVNRCPTCHGETLARTSVINYLSFTVLPLIPLNVNTKYVCNRCLRRQDANVSSRELFPKISATDMLKKSIGIPVIILMFMLFNLYQSYQAQWQFEARQQPKVNDVLYLDNYLRTGSKLDKTFPIRLAKVVEINLEDQTAVLDLSRVAYVELGTAQKDYAVRNHIFDSFYMEHTVELPLTSIMDEQLVLALRRPLGEYYNWTTKTERHVDKYLDMSRFINQQLFNLKRAVHAVKSLASSVTSAFTYRIWYKALANMMSN